MPETTDPHPPFGTREPACRQCGYTLTPSASTTCPECGAAAAMRVVLPGHASLSLIIRDLADAGLLLDSQQSGGGPEGMFDIAYGGTARSGTVWVPVARASEAHTILLARGIDPIAGHLVDRSDPRCPTCGTAMDPSSDATCTGCGVAITWVDTGDEATPDPNETASTPVAARRIPRLGVGLLGAGFLAITLGTPFDPNRAALWIIGGVGSMIAGLWLTVGLPKSGPRTPQGPDPMQDR